MIWAWILALIIAIAFFVFIIADVVKFFIGMGKDRDDDPES